MSHPLEWLSDRLGAAILVLLALALTMGGLFVIVSGHPWPNKSLTGYTRDENGRFALITCLQAGFGEIRIAGGSLEDPSQEIWSAVLDPGATPLTMIPLVPSVDGYRISIHESTVAPQDGIITKLRASDRRHLSGTILDPQKYEVVARMVTTLDGKQLSLREFSNQAECRR